MSDRIKHILIDIAIVIVIPASLFAVYDYLRGSSGPDVVSETPGADLAGKGARALARLNELRALKIDGSFFASPMYMSLEDFSVPPPEEERGRALPFIPSTVKRAPATKPAQQVTSSQASSNLNTLIKKPT